MLRDIAVAMIKKRLKNNNDSSLDADIVTEMQFVQSTVLEGDATLTPWFLLSEEMETQTIVNDHRLVLPSDPEFLMEWEEGCLWLYDETNTEQPYTPLEKEDFDDLRDRYPGSGDTPKGYAFSGNYFWLVPRPSIIRPVRMFYYGRDTVLSSNIENKWLKWAPDWLIGETGKIIAGQYIQDANAYALFEKQANDGKNRLMIKDQAMKEANARRIMGRLKMSSGG